MLQIRGYRLMCGFSAFGGLAVFRQADELVPPPTWGRDGGASGLAPTWPGSGGWGGGVPCPVAPRAPRAGQRPRPRPGEGRAVGGGRGGDSDPPSEAPSLLLGDGDIHLRVGFIWEPPRKRVCCVGRCISALIKAPSVDRGICLGIGPGFMHFWVGIGGR